MAIFVLQLNQSSFECIEYYSTLKFLTFRCPFPKPDFGRYFEAGERELQSTATEQW